MAESELQRRLAHQYDTPQPTDVFGRRPATPNEIFQTLYGISNQNLRPTVVFDGRTGRRKPLSEYEILKAQREERKQQARLARRQQRS